MYESYLSHKTVIPRTSLPEELPQLNFYLWRTNHGLSLMWKVHNTSTDIAASVTSLAICVFPRYISLLIMYPPHSLTLKKKLIIKDYHFIHKCFFLGKEGQTLLFAPNYEKKQFTPILKEASKRPTASVYSIMIIWNNLLFIFNLSFLV